jgi:glutamate formiminotransferase/formiminotetrahydrofolate cyclodeaminase
MEKIVECVPNISEGRDRAKIDAVVAAAGSADGVRVLDVDPGTDTNRTVITFAGNPESVLEGAFRLFKAASEQIDMSRHSGAHPRMGAVDVCPFVPVSGVTMEECAALARRLGQRVASELGVPVYLYEAAAASAGRKSLAAIRKGEYEGLAEKINLPEWKPDFGQAEFNSKFGAAVIGARPFLIAYNINLKTPDKKTAHEIAQAIRESGRPKKGPDGKPLKDSAGNNIVEPGRFKKCAAVGWFIESYGCAQVSINLTDFNVTGMHDVYDACEEEAAKLGIEVSGSELVGLVPREALLRSGRHYLLKNGGFPAASDAELIASAVSSLGLSDLAPFEPTERIIEEKLKIKGSSLLDLTVSQFVDELGSSSVAPGGGSAAALAAALGAALGSMTAALTYINPKLVEHRQSALVAGETLKQLRLEALSAIDEDTKAFKKVIAAFRQRKSLAPEEAAARIEAAYIDASNVPLGVARSAVRLLEVIANEVVFIQQSAISDIAVAAGFARAAFDGAAWNVRINLAELKDRATAEKIGAEIERLGKRAEEFAGSISAAAFRRLAK